ncbi:MAG: type II toxin-antitoxin system PemK/MazF family toxin [Acidimicrobiales bacterium]
MGSRRRSGVDRQRRLGMVSRGDVWWLDFGGPVGSASGYRRPGLLVSSDRFNRSRISTVIVVAITSNPRLAAAPGNVALPSGTAGLPKDSVVKVSQVITIDRASLEERIGKLAREQLIEVDRGLRLALGL